MPKILTPRLVSFEKDLGVNITATVRPYLKDRSSLKTVKKQIENLVEAGVRIFRLNLSHYEPEGKRQGLGKIKYNNRWQQLIRCIDRLSHEFYENVYIMLDTAGPEFRFHPTSDLKKKVGESLTLTADTQTTCDIFIEMPHGFSRFGDPTNKGIYFDDATSYGKVVEESADGKTLAVEMVEPLDLTGGKLTKLNFPEFELVGISSLGREDRRHLAFFQSVLSGKRPVDIHFVAQSFVRKATDIDVLYQELGQGCTGEIPLIVPKIETALAVKNLEEIVSHEHVAGIMIARGDLGNELPREKLGSIQTVIIKKSHDYMKPVLIATEVYGSMGEPPFPRRPTRGEVLDVRHALLAGVDGFVFTGETASRGRDPETPVRFLVEQARVDEEDIVSHNVWRGERDARRERMEDQYKKLLDGDSDKKYPLQTLPELSQIDWAVGAVYRANNRKAMGIFPVTETGTTVRNLAHFLPHRPIFALSHSSRILAQVALHRGAHPVKLDQKIQDLNDLRTLVIDVMIKFDIGEVGEQALATLPFQNQPGMTTLTLITRP